MAHHSCKLNEMQASKLENFCELSGWERYAVQYARYAYRGATVSVIAYQKGTLVVQGKGTEEFVKYTLEPEILGGCWLGYDEVHHP
ncbi:MAG: DUF3378 domain-containing protein, partial [Puniceicoccales bacterium]|nr:DUF3378 domain-containing protein [Puniceicoccales bacterium]